MEQMTLWEPEQPADWAGHPVWQQLDPEVKRNAVIKLSLVIVKTVNPNHNNAKNAQEDNHDQ
jgi:hypothetical protein